MKPFNISEDVRKQAFVCLFLYMGNLIGGINIVWSSPMMVKLQDPDETPLPYPLTDAQVSWLTSLSYIGSITGPHLSGKLSDIIGRKYCLILGGTIMTFGYVLTTFASNVPMLFVGRIIVGSAAAIVIVINLVLISEIASPRIRGILLTLTGVSQAIGSLISYGVGPFLSYNLFHYITLALHGVFLLGTVFIPESPVFHVMKGRIGKAKETFQNLGRTKDTEKELDAITENIKQSQEQRFQIGEIFTIRSNRRGFIICLCLFLLQHCGGVNSVSRFSLTIFRSAGTTVSPQIANITFGVAQLIGTLIAPIVIDRSGRKLLLLLSTIGCCVSMALLGVYFYLDAIEHAVVPSIGWLPLISMLAALLSYNSGLSIVPNSLVGEVFRSNVRSVGSSICLSFGFLAGFAVTLSFGYIMAGIGIHISFFMFTVSNIIGIIFISMYVPETKGKTLSEVQALLSK